MVPRPFRVGRVRRELRDTFTLELSPVDGGAAPTFSAGQFNMLYAFGVGEVAISISGDPVKARTLVHTVRSVGPVTRALCALRRGGTLGVRGPFGAPWPLDAAEGRDVVCVAGGIGIAPLRPALYHLMANRARYGRVVVLAGARTPQDILYARELARWRGRFDLEVHVTVDSAGSDWKGGVGVVTALIPQARLAHGRAVAFVCGPEVMVRYAVSGLREGGVGGDDVYVSMERNMKCAVGFCGHCQFGPTFICKDGPVFRHSRVEAFLRTHEV